MTKLLMLISFCSALLLDSGHFYLPGTATVFHQEETKTEQKFCSERKLNLPDTFRTPLLLPIAMVNPEKNTASRAFWQSVSSEHLFSQGYVRLLRSSGKEKYPPQIQLLFPFHEFT